MFKKVTLTMVSHILKQKKDGSGAFLSCSLKCEELGDVYISGFGGERTQNFRVGDVVEVYLEESGEYMNFRLPSEREVELRKENERMQKENEAYKSRLAEASLPVDLPF